MSEGWNDERRKRQAEICRSNKPWMNATGPRTDAGKARSSANAFKHGGFEEARKLVRTLCDHNRKFLEAAQRCAEIELKKEHEKQASIRKKLQKKEIQTEEFSS